MRITNTSRTLIAGLAVAAGMALAPATASARIFISVGFAPPVIPVYAQPAIPGDGYIWTPGYWAYGSTRATPGSTAPGSSLPTPAPSGPPVTGATAATAATSGTPVTGVTPSATTVASTMASATSASASSAATGAADTSSTTAPTTTSAATAVVRITSTTAPTAAATTFTPAAVSFARVGFRGWQQLPRLQHRRTRNYGGASVQRRPQHGFGWRAATAAIVAPSAAAQAYAGNRSSLGGFTSGQAYGGAQHGAYGGGQRL